MKKVLAISLLIVLAAGTLAACGGTVVVTETTKTTNTATATITTSTTTATTTTVSTTLSLILSKECDITAFSFEEEESPAVIDSTARTIAVTVKYNADITALKPVYKLSVGAAAEVNGEEQINGLSVNDFSNPVIYTIIAEDGVTTKDWSVTVTLGELPEGGVYVPPVIEGAQVITAAEAKDFVDSGTLVAVTATVTGIFTGFGNTVLNCAGVDVNCSGPDILEMPIEEYIGRVITVSGYVTKNPFTQAPEILVDDDEKIILAPEGTEF